MRRLLPLTLMIALTGCLDPVPPTPYQAAPASGGSGYSEVWKDERRAEVRFAGNWRTDRQTVEDGLLFRAAELADQREAPRFAVHDKTIERNVYETVETPPFPSWWYRDRYRSRGAYGRFPPRVRSWTVYTAVMQIEILPEGVDQPENVQVRETEAVLEELDPRIRRPSQSPQS
ncbi:CC0125/CC1285 family lipoprotein [Algihabitans albus]|uniref:CC0125/CC1285 family lipoprotein n=1 Tax=Algihabitans albus TaxID=2164067 RepID=UPI000E5D6C60|nr:hypothetical protein [Algihabitans albus]